MNALTLFSGCLKKIASQILIIIFLFVCGISAYAQPANDDPCAANLLTVSATCSFQTFTNAAATASTGVPDPGCASYLGGDVWFQVVVPPGGAINFNSQAGVITDGGMAIYSGTCSGLTLIDCDDDAGAGNMPFISASGLIPGNTIWIRFWEYGNNGNGTFGICLTIPPPPPSNDEPCNAITLDVSQNGCNFQTFTNESATSTAGVPAPGCANYLGGDVWFKLTVPCTGSIILDSQTGFITDGGMAIYSGTCNNLTLIECDDDDSPNGFMPRISRTGLIPGSTIWVRMWEYGNDGNGTFGLCAQVPPPPPPAATCQTAQSFCTSVIPTTVPNITGQPSTGGSGTFGCLLTTPNPTYYYLQIQNSGSISITISQNSTTGTPLDVDFIVWGPFNNLNATCTGISASNIIDCSYLPDPVEVADIPNALAGQFYLFLVTNYSDQPGSITYQQTGGTGSSNCSIVCTLNAGNTGPVCSGGPLNLTASTVTNATYLWTGPNCFTSTQQNPTGVTAPLIPGQYIYTVTATGPNGVTCSDTTLVTVSPKPVLAADISREICSGNTIDLTNIFNTSGLNTAWTFAGIPVVNITSVSAPGVYQLIATNATGCSDTALFTLVTDVVASTVSAINADCVNNGTITVTNVSGISPYVYSISTNPGVTQVSNVFSAPAGTYTITTIDSLGCIGTNPVTISFTDNLVLTGRMDTSICKNQSVVLNTVSNATIYSWSPTTGLNNPSIASPVASPLTNTTYMLLASLGSCSKTYTVNISVTEPVLVDAGQPISIIQGDHIKIFATATGATNYSWTPATGLNASTILSPIAQPAITTLYTITATNALGCSSSDDVLITVIPYCVRVRNAFTPNGDGINDLWLVYDNYECLRNVTVHVFNRYGSEVYSSKDYHDNWDGRFKGKSVPDGTYYGVIDFTLVNGKVFTMKTDLTILR